MFRREVIVSLLFSIGLLVVFFHKTIFQGLIPFPGDLLVSEYKPWQTYSYLGYAPSAIPSKAQYFDVVRQLYPWKTLSLDLLRRGEMPLWNPYSFSGSPLLGNVQSAVFYPLNVVYALFPQAVGWTVLIIFQPLLSGVFTYLFARKIGIGPLGSLLASMAFSYSLFMSVFLEYNTIGHAILWLPLILFSIEQTLTKVTVERLFLFVLSVVLSFLAGHLQLFGFVLLFALAYAFLRILHTKMTVRKKTSYLAMFLTLSLLSFGIVSFQLLPTLELIHFSARVAHDYEFLIAKLLIQPEQAMLFVSPDFFGNPAARNYLIPDTYPGNALYIGLVPFMFALLVSVRFQKNWHVRFFSIVSLVLVILLFRSPVTEFLYRVQIPLFSTGSPTNSLFILSLSLSILAGFGSEQWIKENRGSDRFVVGTVTLLLLAVWVFVFSFRPHSVSVNNLLFTTVLFFLFLVLYFGAKRLSLKKIAVFLMLTLTVFDLFYFFQKFNPFVPPSLVFPKADVFTALSKKAGIDRFWGYGTAAIEANFATQYKLFSPDGYDPLYPRWYGEFIHAAKEGKLLRTFTTTTRSDAMLAGGFGEEDLPSNRFRLRVLDLLGVRYILDRVENKSTEKTFPNDRFTLVYDREGWRIFENNKALPRAFLASNYQVFRNKGEFEKIFFSKDFDPAKEILLEEKPQVHFNDIYHLSSARVVSYAPHEVDVEVSTDTTRLLFLSDTYYPGWKGFIDGRETKMYRANYAFRAVVVPKGAHTVRFSFHPQSFSLGLKLTIISLILLFPTVLLLRKHYAR